MNASQSASNLAKNSYAAMLPLLPLAKATIATCINALSVVAIAHGAIIVQQITTTRDGRRASRGTTRKIGPTKRPRNWLTSFASRIGKTAARSQRRGNEGRRTDGSGDLTHRRGI